MNELLSSLKLIIGGLSTHFGNDCEIVIHDYSKPFNNTIVAIENGHITNRKVGDCGTNFSLEVLRKGENQEDKFNYINYINGKTIRSSTIYIRDKFNKIEGSVCINSDITNFMIVEKTIQNLINTNNVTQSKEFFSNDVNELLYELVKQSIDYVGMPVAFMNKQQKIKGLEYLDEKGAFLIKKSGEIIAEKYDISKFTIYNYLQKK